MVSVSIIGASGYSGGELLRILAQHKKIDDIAATSRSHAGKKFSEIHKGYPVPEGTFTSEEDLEADFIFTATPAGVAMGIANKMDFNKSKLIDLSGDFRLPAKVYEAWYGIKHTAPALLSQAVYGLPEINRAKIKKAKLISNPGCYPTGAILALAPLLSKKLITSPLFVDSRSGYSGAGHQPDEWKKKAESYGYFMPYGIPKHKHTPEMEKVASEIAGSEISICFSPMLLPVFRGLLTYAHAALAKKISQEELDSLYKEFYKGEQFIKLFTDVMPNIKRTDFTNNCEISPKLDSRTNSVIAISAIDNLVKGASGQAVQNMNIMAGFREDEGLGIIDKCGP